MRSSSSSGRGVIVAIVGAGMGGLAAAAALRKVGIEALIYEQAPEFARVGAGIHVAANAVKVLRGLGLRDDVLFSKAFVNETTMHREFDTAKLTGQLDHGEEATKRFGAPYTTWHRGDLHEALAALVPASMVRRGKHVVGVDADTSSPTLHFADGTVASADVIVGADGVHSVIRSTLFDVAPPRFTDRVAYRAIVSRDAVNEPNLDSSCKWWGPDRHLVHYYVSAGREIAFTTSVPDATWNVESWSAEGDIDVFRDAFAAFHPYVQKIIWTVQRVHRWAINAHDPMSAWSSGNVVLLGDACHTVTPYMGQGAALAMEDAVVLARALAAIDGDKDGVPEALRRYEAARKPRTSHVQRLSEQNTWGRYGADTGWLYGYDAWTVSLDDVPKVA